MIAIFDSREVDAFKGWPVGMVLDHPQDCLFHFFKRGAVMVPDSKNSEWLYIVKTGMSRQESINIYSIWLTNQNIIVIPLENFLPSCLFLLDQ